MSKKSLDVIIPCYNESAGIGYLSKKLQPIVTELSKDYFVKLIFVDDGSTDNTVALIGKYFKSFPRFKIEKHATNMNLGAAMRTGFKAATADIIATIDSDCTYDPESIIKMLKLLGKEADIVTVSPYHPQGEVENIPEYRLFLSRSISFIYGFLLGPKQEKIYTFTALNRVCKKEVVKNITFKSNNFLATAELLIYAMLQGYKVKELPAVLHVRKYGQSKIRLLQVIVSHARFVLKLIAFRLGLSNRLS